MDIAREGCRRDTDSKDAQLMSKTTVLKTALPELMEAVKRSRLVAKMSLLELWEVPEQRKRDISRPEDAVLLKSIIKKWKHYKPSGNIKITILSQYNLEKELKRKW